MHTPSNWVSLQCVSVYMCMKYFKNEAEMKRDVWRWYFLLVYSWFQWAAIHFAGTPLGMLALCLFSDRTRFWLDLFCPNTFLLQCRLMFYALKYEYVSSANASVFSWFFSLFLYIRFELWRWRRSFRSNSLQMWKETVQSTAMLWANSFIIIFRINNINSTHKLHS